MSTDDIGPRRQALLQSWKEHILTKESGSGFDFSPMNRTAEAQRKTEAFVQDPSEDSLEEIWSRDIIADSVFGGSTALLNKWDGEVNELAQEFEQIQEATEFDPIWERHFLTDQAVWELYGRLHPDIALILNSECSRGLSYMGFSRPSTYIGAQTEWNEFRSVYETHVGHATAGTDHEVPLNHEMSEFLWFVATTDEEELRQILLADVDEYRPLVGWRDETPLSNDIQFSGLMPVLDGYVTAKKEGGFERDGPDDLWNQGYWEDWKGEYLQHMETQVKPKYDLTDLSGTDIEPLLDDLTESTTLSTPIPSYMLGGRQGGILWSEFKKASLENPKEAAATLSYLFDTDEDINIRLDRFATFYRNLDTSGGPLLSLATVFLTFAYPQDYVFYKYSRMNHFFDEFADYNVRTGFNTDQYWKLNTACKTQILDDLTRDLDDATMLDVYTLLYVWDGNYND